MEWPGWTEPSSFTWWRASVSQSGLWWVVASWLDYLEKQSHFPTRSGLESCSWGGSEDTEEVGLSATGSGAGCARACGVRRTYGKGSSGSSTGSPWNIIFSSSLFFFLSGWGTNALYCPCPFMKNLVHGGRICAIRSQMSVYWNWSGCPGVPGAMLGQLAGQECPLVVI